MAAPMATSPMILQTKIKIRRGILGMVAEAGSEGTCSVVWAVGWVWGGAVVRGATYSGALCLAQI